MRRRLSPACRASLERLSRYVDGELAATARQGIVRHLRQCRCCHELVDGLKRTAALCHAASGPWLPANVRVRAKARIARLLAEPRVSPRPSRPTGGR